MDNKNIYSNDSCNMPNCRRNAYAEIEIYKSDRYGNLVLVICSVCFDHYTIIHREFPERKFRHENV